MERRQSSNRNSSIISLQSSSFFNYENQEIINELAEKLHTDGSKVLGTMIAVAYRELITFYNYTHTIRLAT